MDKKRSDKKRKRFFGGQLSLPVFVLLLFLAAGVVSGYVFSLSCAGETLQISTYLADFLHLKGKRGSSAPAVIGILTCYFRAPLFAFLLGFTALGTVLIPVLCCFEGFLFSFSLFSFALSLGTQRFALLIALFSFRMLFLLPCILVSAAAAWEKSRALSRRFAGSRFRPMEQEVSYWSRFGIVCVCLFLGSLLELWLLPQFLLLAAR